ncbi:MAG: L17 family ribosomal protein [bacterium]|nr:L17 family ribosomal protein [bacterium]
MIKRNRAPRIGRSKGGRLALFRSLSRELLKHGKIETSIARAKAVRPFLAKVARAAKKGDVTSKRRVAALLSADKDFITKFAVRAVGLRLRIIKLVPRKGDASPRARIEIIEDLPAQAGKKEVVKENV